MNWDAIGAIAELAGALGVLVSIVYLATQVRNNTAESKTHRTQDLMTGVADVSARIASDPELSEIVRCGAVNFESLDEKEKFRFSFLFFSVITKYDFSFHQYRDGKIEQGIWSRSEYELSTYMGLPGSRQWWETDKARFSPELREYLDEILSTSETKHTVPAFGAIRSENDA